MFFIWSEQSFLFSRYLNCSHDILGKQEIKIDEKNKVNFKMHYVTTWFTNNSNTYITQYLTKVRQPYNEIWSVNRT